MGISQRRHREKPTISSNALDALRSEESGMGAEMDQQRFLVRPEVSCLCGCGGDFLQRVLLRPVLAEEAWDHARSHLLQRADLACLLYKKLQKQISQEEVHKILMSAVKCEKMFVTDSLPVGLIGMNATMMGKYIEFCADRLAYALGVDKIYNTPNPFEWMEMISLQDKTNFFERRVGEYQKAGVMANKEENCFDLECDF